MEGAVEECCLYCLELGAVYLFGKRRKRLLCEREGQFAWISHHVEATVCGVDLKPESSTASKELAVHVDICEEGPLEAEE